MAAVLKDPRADRAATLAAEGRWADAAATWESLALDLADPATAAMTWSLVADAWRREDRPVASARALRRALQLSPAEAGASLLRVQLAAALADAGQHLVACDLVDEAEALASSPNERLLALDMGVGLATLSCAWDLAERRLSELAVPVAHAFRRAALARAQGERRRAEDELDRADGLCDPGAASAGLRASLAGERAELLLELGRADEALDAVDTARRTWSSLGRRGPLFALVATELRVRLALGESPLEAEANRAIGYAEERGLFPLRQDLLLARGLVRRSRGDPSGVVDVGEAIALARRIGAELVVRRSLTRAGAA